MSDAAEDACGAVADETRVRMLRALWDADDPLSCRELRDRVDVRDSGRFNYHLGELRGRFVEKREDGYALRFAGRELVGALHSGVFTEDASVDPAPVDGDCVVCGGPLEAAYEDEQARVTCLDCGAHALSVEIPPAFVDGREDDLATAIDGYVRTMARQFAAGFCSACRAGRSVASSPTRNAGRVWSSSANSVPTPSTGWLLRPSSTTLRCWRSTTTTAGTPGTSHSGRWSG
jgi:hypothetical protein